MACPLFVPDAPLAGFPAESTPLGDLYSGHCASEPGLVIPPETLRRCCNRGYARAACSRAATVDADAFRFLVRSDDGETVTVAWSVERDHLPVATGNASISKEAPPLADPLYLQARATASAYRRLAGKARIEIHPHGI